MAHHALKVRCQFYIACIVTDCLSPDFEYAMPSLPQQASYPSMPHFPGPSSYALQPEHESNLSDLSSKMNSFLTEMDTQIVIHGLPDQILSKRQRRLPLELELDAADFSAAATLSRVPSAANSRARASPHSYLLPIIHVAYSYSRTFT